jgi:hypothetical protein
MDETNRPHPLLQLLNSDFVESRGLFSNERSRFCVVREFDKQLNLTTSGTFNTVTYLETFYPNKHALILLIKSIYEKFGYAKGKVSFEEKSHLINFLRKILFIALRNRWIPV